MEPSKMPLYIFDMDGTLSLTEHRTHFISGDKKEWDKFFKACHQDPPNTPVVQLLNQLNYSAEIRIFSGRSDLVLAKTLVWLSENTTLSPLTMRENLIMRKEGDFTPDDILKKGWYNDMSDVDKERLVCIFDDRDKVVAMWRELGITCLQVNPGDF